MPKPSPERFTVLVVDDEPPARRRLVEQLRRHAFVGAIHEAANGLQAVTVIQESAPDLVLLDVQMPELDGLGVIANVGVSGMPLTVFVTAYDRYAIRAFEANALDYLLKPFSDERFAQALERARTRLGRGATDEARDGMGRLLAGEGAAAADERSSGPRYLDRLVVRCKDGVRLLPSSEIDWIEAQGVYVSLHAGRASLLHRASLQELAGRLSPRDFTRIHRSVIVAVDRIARLEPHTHGEYTAILADGTRLRVSRTYRAALEGRLGQPL
jgi:two-component system, LytTR family, response regulator